MLCIIIVHFYLTNTSFYTQELISKAIENSPRYTNVYDIIQHVEEMSKTRKNIGLETELHLQINPGLEKKFDSYHEKKPPDTKTNVRTMCVNIDLKYIFISGSCN